jgi:hypothetical protein
VPCGKSRRRRQVGDGLLGQGGQHRGGAEHIGCVLLAELRAEALTAKPVGAANGGKQRGVQGGSETEADIGGRQY